MSSTSLGLDSAALQRDLDLTINQRLNVNYTDREAGGQEHARKSLAAAGLTCMGYIGSKLSILGL